MKQNDKDLKACPFCGGEAEWTYSTSMDGQIKHPYVACSICEASAISFNVGEEAQAAKAWNTRTPDINTFESQNNENTTLKQVCPSNMPDISALVEIIDEELEFERQELKDIRSCKGDASSYGAGYSTGVIQTCLKLKEALSTLKTHNSGRAE